MRAVALVGIRVDHEHTQGRMLRMKAGNRNCHVIENAIPEALISKGVVSSSGEIAGQAILLGGSGRAKGAAHFQLRADQESSTGRESKSEC